MKKTWAERGILFRLILTMAIVSIVAATGISQVVRAYLKNTFEKHYLERTRDVLELCFLACDDAFQQLLSMRQENDPAIEEAVKKDALLQLKNIGKAKGDKIHTVVLDLHGKILASSIKLTDPVTFEHLPQSSILNCAPNYKLTKFTNNDGKTLIGFSKFFPGWRWQLISAVEVSDIVAASKPTINIILLGFAIEIAVMVLAFLTLFSLRVYNPLKKLRRATDKLKDGDYVQLEWQRRDEVGLIASAFDNLSAALKEREQKMEEAKRKIFESERKFQDIFEKANDIITLIDTAGRIMDINQRAQDLLGIDKESLIGKSLTDLVADNYKEVGKSLIENIKSEGKAFTFELGISALGRKEIYFEASCKRFSDEKRGKASAICVLRDITEKKKIEEEVLQTKNLLENIIEHTIDALVIIDSDGHIIRVNQKFKDISGFRAIDIVGVPYKNIVANEEELRPILKELEEKGLAIEKEISCKLKNGTIVPVEVSAKRIYDTDRNHQITVVVGRDLREKKNLQIQLLRAQKMEAIGTLAGGIAHDFNNLLTAVKGFTQIMLLNESLDSVNKQYLKQIEHAANRASDLTRQLLTFSRKVRSEMQPVELNREVKEVTKLLTRTLPKMIRITTQLTPRLTLVNADPSQIEQILMNLAVNARDAMPDGGELSIGTDLVYLDNQYCKRHFRLIPGHYVLLYVQDTGVGMDPETRERIYDPFFTTKEVGKGTGLGLAMVYGIVENHNGHIICYSEKEKGTIFKIYFPVFKESQVIRSEAQQLISSDLPGGSETILIIDDEESVRKLAYDLLTRYGYSVLTAKSGEEGIQIYKQNMSNIDLIILDFIMPGMSGDKCLKQLLRIDPDANVVIASGFALGKTLNEMLDGGAKAYLHKPFSVKSILEIVRSSLDKIHGINTRVASHI